MNISGLFKQPGTIDASEAHLWANIGKGIACWLLVYHTDKIIEHWEFAAVLLAALVIPKTFERILLAKFNASVPASA